MHYPNISAGPHSKSSLVFWTYRFCVIFVFLSVYFLMHLQVTLRMQTFDS
jgi:hypothetical protein